LVRNFPCPNKDPATVAMNSPVMIVLFIIS
jgi:hypothetical protein